MRAGRTVAEESRTPSGSVVEGLCTVEGRLGDYFWHGDRSWDLVFLGLTRERWSAFADGWLDPTESGSR